ncbi:MAG: trehalose-6-phosphate synthase [Clostridia bacterium]|nr:trehalose-6-phosphate synthase [Clostridia bacterium]
MDGRKHLRRPAGSRSGEKGKLILVSNRGPATLAAKGSDRPAQAVSGLVSAVEPLINSVGGVWVAWDGQASDTSGVTRQAVSEFLSLRGISLSSEEIESYYHGVANGALWPLCHYFVDKCKFRSRDWEGYRKVNQKFAWAVLDEASPLDWVWVHDYHLALLPGILRQTVSRQRIAFYWHIPFPQEEVFQLLPWADELLEGLLGSNLIGFHLERYATNFLASCKSILGARVDWEENTVSYKGHVTKVMAVPIGIEFSVFDQLARSQTVRTKASQAREAIGAEQIILGVERLDYTKGIVERLLAMEALWEKYPEYRGKASLVQVGVPTRSGLDTYDNLRAEIERQVARINGRFGTLGWLPIYYIERPLGREDLCAYYAMADVALVTPLRDGLNLVAKEYIASRKDSGVLVLSRFAGAAEELEEALLVNPYCPDEIREAVRRALTMPLDEQQRRLAALRKKIKSHDVHWWLGTFLKAFYETSVSLPIIAGPLSEAQLGPDARPADARPVGKLLE